MKRSKKYFIPREQCLQHQDKPQIKSKLRDIPFHLWALEGQISPSLLASPEDLEDRHHQVHQVVQDFPIAKIIPCNTGVISWQFLDPVYEANIKLY